MFYGLCVIKLGINNNKLKIIYLIFLNEVFDNLCLKEEIIIEVRK